jgi:L-asparaginase II
VQLAREILVGAGLSESALRCGTHPPAHDESRRAMTARGEKPSAIHNNCSGKHGGMLSVCVRRGWDPATYLSPEHPLQREIAGILCEFTGMDAGALTYGVDGCGVPTFRVPMVRFAHGLARYARGSDDVPHAVAARRLFDAMTAHPEIVGGTGRFCTELPRAARRPLLAKAGAEGFYAVAWREDSGRGVALVAKSAAGDSRSRDFAVTEALYQLGVLDRAGLEKMAPFHGGPMKNHAGTVVGKMTSMLALGKS